jgi:hypothetical protein
MLNIVAEFNQVYTQLEEVGLVSPALVRNYYKASRGNLHSLLNYALAVAGIRSGYFALPEYKLSLQPPLLTLKGKYRHFIQVDVAFFKGKDLKGIGEVYTLDLIHGCLLPDALVGKWQTPRVKLNHLVSVYPGIFVVIVNVIPQDAKMPPWEEVRWYSLPQWRQLWEQLVNDLKGKGAAVHHIVVE